MGRALFNLVEGIIDQQLLGVHHVYEHTDDKLPWDQGSLLLGGVLMLIIGWLLVRVGSGDSAPRGGVDRA